VAEEEMTAAGSSIPPSPSPPPPPPPPPPAESDVGGAILARARGPLGAQAAARRALMARELERHAAATDKAGTGTG
jgi:hypothetical protein